MKQALAVIQQIVSADKTAIVSAGVSVLGLLAAKFGFRLNGSDTAYVAAVLMGLVGVFLHAHFAAAGRTGPPAPVPAPVLPAAVHPAEAVTAELPAVGGAAQ